MIKQRFQQLIFFVEKFKQFLLVQMYYNYYLFRIFVSYYENIKTTKYVQNTYLRRTPH